MGPSDLKNVSHTCDGDTLRLHTLKHLPLLRTLANILQESPSIAHNITAITIFNQDNAFEEEEGEEEEEEYLRPLPVQLSFNEKVEQHRKNGVEISAVLTEIIENISKNGMGLKDFNWFKPCGQDLVRSKEFWEALWGAAGELEELSLGFYTHELQGLTDIVAPPAPFSKLTKLHIEASSAHGDNGSLIHNILLSSPSIEDLSLTFPGCDLEDCRIKNITWEYTFPVLSRLRIRMYAGDKTAIINFLDRNASIKDFTWDINADDPFELRESVLQNVEILRLECWPYIKYSQIVDLGMVSLVSQRSLNVLELRGISDRPYAYPCLMEMAKPFGSLELRLDIKKWRRGTRDASNRKKEEDEEICAALKRKRAAERGGEMSSDSEDEEEEIPVLQESVGDFLGELDAVQKLTVSFEASKYFTIGEDDEEEPTPMDLNDLKSFLQAISKSTSLRALRITDQKASPLSEEMLNALADFDLPQSLKFLQWDIAATKEDGVFSLHQEDGKTKFVSTVGNVDLFDNSLPRCLIG